MNHHNYKWSENQTKRLYELNVYNYTYTNNTRTCVR